MTDLLEFYQQAGLVLSLVVLATFFLAGTVKGMIGVGLPTVSMGLLGLVIAPAQAAALLVVPSMLTNFWQMAAGGHLRSLLVRLWPMLLAVIAGTAMGTQWLGLSRTHWVGHALGSALLLYALFGLLAPTLQVRASHERLLGPLCGLLTGIVTAGTGIFVIPAVPYLQALGLGRDELIQAMGLSFTVSTLALAGGLLWHQQLGGTELSASVLVLLPTLLGMLAGQWLRHRISPLLFKRIFFIGLALLGGHLLVNG